MIDNEDKGHTIKEGQVKAHKWKVLGVSVMGEPILNKGLKTMIRAI